MFVEAILYRNISLISFHRFTGTSYHQNILPIYIFRSFYHFERTVLFVVCCHETVFLKKVHIIWFPNHVIVADWAFKFFHSQNWQALQDSQPTCSWKQPVKLSPCWVFSSVPEFPRLVWPVFRRRLFLTEYIESLTIVVESLFTLCGKSFFTKRGESLFTQCGGSRHNFELWCRSSLELFDLWRKWDENNSNNITQDCMLLSRNAKNHAMKNHPELWIIIIADHAIESWTGINSNTWMGRHQGSAEVGCLQWWIPWGCSRWSRSPWCPPTTPPRSSTPPSTLSAPHSAPRNDPSPPGSSSTSQSWQRCKFWQ